MLASLAVLASGLGTGSAHAADPTALYVNVAAAGCSDTGPGSQSVPFCQIQAAAAAATAGDTVNVSYGTYQPVTFTNSGTADAPITFTGVGAPTEYGFPAIQGGTSPAMDFVGVHDIDLNGFVAGGAASAAVAVDGASADISFSRMRIGATAGWGVTVGSGAQHVTLADTHVVTTKQGGVSATGTTGIVMAGDTVFSPCGEAVSLADGSSGSIENTVISGSTTACDPLHGPAQINVDASSAAAGVIADYNAVNPPAGGVDYSWAGTEYSTADAFAAATGQGGHDLDQTDGSFSGLAGPAEHSLLINSADANAPGELATDIQGHVRIEDPLVPSTGTGTGGYDRGAYQFQDPLYFSLRGFYQVGNIAPYRPTVTVSSLYNPWNDQLLYSFDFGDGSPATAFSAATSATHDYTTGSDLRGFPLTVTAKAADGRTWTDKFYVQVATVRLSAALTSSRQVDLPDTVSFHYTTTSSWPVVSDIIDFGDGTTQTATSASGSFSHTYAQPGTYDVTDTVNNGNTSTANTQIQVTAGTAFVPVSPVRILDTRHGIGAAQQQVGPGGVLKLKVAGANGIPATGTAAVTMNLTDVNATSGGYVTAYPDGTSRPVASNLNFLAGQVNPNLVTVPVGADGYVDLYNDAGRVDLVADVQGYYTTSSDGSALKSDYAAATPTRVLDTRSGIGARKGTVAAGRTVAFKLPALPANATAANLNVTETGATVGGYVTAYCGTAATPPSTASDLNFRKGQTTSNLVAVPVCAGGYVSLYNASGSVSLVADLQGYYSTSSGNPFVPVTPTRLLDTREKGSIGPLHANDTVFVGADMNSAGASMLVNVTGVSPTTATWLSAFGGGALPATSNLDLTAGETRPVLAAVPVYLDSNGDPGGFHLHNYAGQVGVVADLEGYFS
ncbi:hypothetical protein EDD99_3568 [Streptomyces sp. 846.5]|nr:hypothetical protein EDD99_3568 [Streptomyces sp. 846.5]